MRVMACLAAALAACSPTHPVRAERHPTAALVHSARALETLADFRPDFFVTLAGEPLPFHPTPGARAAEDGWTVQPAFARGQPAAYVVSELWVAHPDPWIQPVYILMNATGELVRQKADDGRVVPIVFGVGEESTFYSPYWQAILVRAQPAPPDGLPDTRAVLEAATELVEGAKPLCPITPEGFGLARAGGAAVHPLTQTPLKPVSGGRVRIDGATAAYIDFGLDRFLVTAGGLVLPTRIFFFTRMVNGQRTLLELPAVLANNAVRSGYARRFDVVLDHETVFVPAGGQWDAVRARLGAAATDPAIPTEVANAYALRVAKTSTCFASAATFPMGCDWLDSESAIDLLEPRRIIRTEVTMTAVPLLFAGEAL